MKSILFSLLVIFTFPIASPVAFITIGVALGYGIALSFIDSLNKF